ncbi:MAG: Uncharacterised protein [Prochlorococcus marinus str. MIT 9313]|nr:MAG: Uncharacterised protein [Prochlorococcus marinus str. MIT 9313]
MAGIHKGPNTLSNHPLPIDPHFLQPPHHLQADLVQAKLRHAPAQGCAHAKIALQRPQKTTLKK